MEARETALGLLDDVLAKRLTRVGDLRRAWPEAGPDFLLRRARQEAEHYLVTKGDLERRIVVLLKRFLLDGGTAAELEAAYDRVIRESPGEP